MDHQDALFYLVGFAACAWIAYRIIAQWWPAVGRRGKPVPHRAPRRSEREMEEERLRSATRFGSRRKTLVVALVSVLSWFAWVATLAYSRPLFLALLAYLGVGFILNRRWGLPSPADLAGLDFADRFTLRVFHGWLWPLHLWVLRSRTPKARDE